MRLAIVALVVAGCGAGVEIGGECSLESRCVEGAVCDFTDPAGPVCIDADGDLDGDGLPNDRDFCNHVAGGEFDEDGDGIGDDCDRCPIAPPPRTPDSDDDAVDSPCDPDPDIPGDQIVVFDGFARGLPEGWTATAGWTFENGEAIATPVNESDVERIVVNLPLITLQAAVLAEYRIDDVDPLSSQNFAGVAAVDARPAGGSEIQCVGTRTGTRDRLVIDTELEINGIDFANLFSPTDSYGVGLKLDNADAGCAIFSGDEAGAAQARTLGEVSNQADLVVRGASARFSYLLVIQRVAEQPN
jgi:hypothetical protein